MKLAEVKEVSYGSGVEFTTLFRYLVSSGTGYALGAGWINSEVQQALIGMAGIAAPLIWGWIASRRNRQLKIDVATGDKTLVLKRQDGQGS